MLIAEVKGDIVEPNARNIILVPRTKINAELK
jgi:hypothetical protein